MRLIIFSILEYNEKLIYYFVSRGARWAGVIILEYNDIIGENRISELYFLAQIWWKHHEKKGDPKVPNILVS